MTTKQQILSTLAAQKSVFLTRFGVDEVGLFGSYIRDEQRTDSDIDLLIHFAENKDTFNNFMSFTEYIESVFSGYTVEVVSKGGLSPHIGKYILQEVVYA